MKRLTPVLCVDDIEPVLDFWVDRLGFTKTVEVPAEGRIGFLILQKGPIEIMYQTHDSVAEDIPALAGHPMSGTMLFLEVEDLDAVARSLQGISLVAPRRKTFYGAEEIIVREPGGNVVTFAQFAS